MQKKKVLLTAARLPVCLDLARTLAQHGFEVVVVDSMAVHLCQSSNAVKRSYRVPAPQFHPQAYQREILKILADERPDLMIPTCEEVLYLAEIHDDIARYTVPVFDPIERLKPLHSKKTFIDFCQQHALPVPESAVWQPQAFKASSLGDTHNPSMAEDSMAEDSVAEHALEDTPAGSHDQSVVGATQSVQDHSHPCRLLNCEKVVLKPEYSRGGAAIHFLKKSDEVGHIRSAGEGNRWVAQRFLPGKVICSFALMHKGEILFNIIYEPLAKLGEVSVCYKRIRHAASEAWIRSFAQKTSYSGFVSFDFITEYPDDSRAASGAVSESMAIECNPRITSGLHLVDPQLLVQAIVQFVQAKAKGESQSQSEVDAKETRAIAQGKEAVNVKPLGEQPRFAGVQSRADFCAFDYGFQGQRQKATMGLGLISGSQALLRRPRTIPTVAWHVLRSREVVFSVRDPLPFFYQIICISYVLYLARVHSISLLQSTTWECEYNS